MIIDTYLINSNEAKKFIKWIKLKYPNSKFHKNYEEEYFIKDSVKELHHYIFFVNVYDYNIFHYFDYIKFTKHKEYYYEKYNFIDWNNIIRKEKIKNLLLKLNE